MASAAYNIRSIRLICPMLLAGSESWRWGCPWGLGRGKSMVKQWERVGSLWEMCDQSLEKGYFGSGKGLPIALR